MSYIFTFSSVAFFYTRRTQRTFQTMFAFRKLFSNSAAEILIISYLTLKQTIGILVNSIDTLPESYLFQHLPFLLSLSRLLRLSCLLYLSCQVTNRSLASIDFDELLRYQPSTDQQRSMKQSFNSRPLLIDSCGRFSNSADYALPSSFCNVYRRGSVAGQNFIYILMDVYKV